MAAQALTACVAGKDTILVNLRRCRCLAGRILMPRCWGFLLGLFFVVLLRRFAIPVQQRLDTMLSPGPRQVAQHKERLDVAQQQLQIGHEESRRLKFFGPFRNATCGSFGTRSCASLCISCNPSLSLADRFRRHHFLLILLCFFDFLCNSRVSSQSYDFHGFRVSSPRA